MTKAFVADISQLNTDISLYRDYVSAYRYEKALKYKNAKDGLLSVGAELLLYKFLGRRPSYTVDAYGKPVGECVHFNFSHSGDIVVCAVSENPAGADVEKIRDINLDIAKKKFCESEYENIISSANSRDSFFEYWVKKESYVKALGMGLRIPLNEFDTDKIEDWKFTLCDVEGYKICVCATEKAEFEKIKWCK